jgi:hypothetical protein
MTIRAHFNGKVIVPDEPLDLPANQALILEIKTVAVSGVQDDNSALSWLAENAVDSDELPRDLADHHDHHLYGRPIGGG